MVVGAGVSGLAAAWELRSRRPTCRLKVLDAADRVGGAATTDQVGGYTIERGPNGVLSNVDHTLRLAREVGLSEELIAADPNARRRYLYRAGKLRPVPKSLPALDMLGPVGIARAIAEKWVAPKADREPESVRDFLGRRFGKRVASLLSDIAVSGVSGGDPDRTSVAALFPKLAAAEHEEGSVLNWLSARKKASSEKIALHSFRRGMQALPDAIAQALGCVETSTDVESLERDDFGWVVRTGQGSFRTREVILAVGSDTASQLLRTAAPGLGAQLRGIPYAGMRVMSVGVRREQVRQDLAGFGFLVPRGEGVRILGSVWSSSIFSHRAPAGRALFRVMIGGQMDPAAVTESDESIEAEVLVELAAIVGLEGTPELVHHTKWTTGIPQYELGHLGRWARIRDAAAGIPGLHLCGNAYDGVSVNECIRYGREVAAQVSATE